jgi:hypothetical protein
VSLGYCASIAEALFFYFGGIFMKNTKVTLIPLTADDREQFILDKQHCYTTQLTEIIFASLRCKRS